MGALVVAATIAIPPSVAAADPGVPSSLARVPVSRASVSSGRNLWRRAAGPVSVAARGSADVRAPGARVWSLDRGGMRTLLSSAPRERTAAARRSPLTLSLPAPDGGFQRFAVQESPVMQPGLAARHPGIKTYEGRGIDDPSANIRFAMTGLGFSASVRGAGGMWYIDAYSRSQRDLYLSYFQRDLTNRHGSFVFREARKLERATRGAAAGAAATVSPAAAGISIGSVLRTYRLALVSDDSYADYWGAANVTAGKVLLVNRVDQLYEQDLAIRMVLVANNDLLNLNTTAMTTGTNGPCGSAACYTTSQLDGCDSPTLTRNRFVIGQLVGADNYDIGHIVLGVDGGGIAGLGVVGRLQKAEGCTGIPEPEGDGFAVDYVAHEMGHEFGANHTFNGTTDSCGGGNRVAADSVEPGGGTTIMAYAGICGTDDLQGHSDPYFSERSFDEITDYVASVRANQTTEIQTVSLRDFSGTDSFTLRYNGNDSAPIVRGSNYSQAGIVSAIKGIAGFPTNTSDLNVAVAGFFNGSFGDTGFQVTFSGALASAGSVTRLGLTNPSGTTGFVGVTVRGGPVLNQGFTVTATGNTAPTISAPAAYTIPYRTPFSLTGSGSDAEGDTVTYLWEQNDAGTGSTSLVSNTKTNGPLFRVFGSTYDTAVYDPLVSPAPGSNAAGTSPTRVFPDMAQILANNTNAATGSCPAAGAAPVAPDTVECYSEFLPTPGYAGPMHFRLTARDGHPGGGGVSSAETTVSLASGTGPFLVTSPNTAVSYPGGSSQTVTWSVAGTAAAPIGATNVAILLSVDGGATFPYTLAASTANDGSESVTIPAVPTTHARIEVKPVGNVFFDVSNADFSITSPLQSQTITFNSLPDKVYGDPNFSVSASASSGLAVVFSASGTCSISGATVHIITPGSCTISANQPGNGSYAPAPQVSRTFTINKASQTIIFSSLLGKRFGDPDFNVAATASSGLPVGFAATGSCTVAGVVVHLTGVGSCTVTASQPGDTYFNAAPDVARTFQVSPRVTVTKLATTPKKKVRHGKTVTLTATVTATGVFPTSPVRFFQDGVLLGTATPNATGKAVFTFTATVVGPHVMLAQFTDPAGNFTASSGTKNLKIT